MKAKTRKILIITSVAVLGTAILVLACLPPWLAGRQHSLIYQDPSSVPAANVAIVFGAGLKTNGTPSDVLDDRLNVAAQLYHDGKAPRLLVSGDNRFVNYSEPDVMKQTLITKYGVTAEDVHADYAGRRTYDTCARAHELWGVKRAILVTQEFHLPRALWTCRHLGIESVGVSATLRSYVKDALFETREFAALYKTFLDLYVWSPSYVRGAFVTNLN